MPTRKKDKPNPEATGENEPVLDTSGDKSASRHTRFLHWSKERMTSLERKIWDLLGKEGNVWFFKPQQELHGYLVDFYSAEFNLVIEADGPDHIWSYKEDEERDNALRAKGINTLRLTPGDLVQYTPQEIFDIIEEFCKVTHRPESK